ncbi:HMG1/2-like protein [Actinidia chinensis var. chinensis]|uniref:HMG1/2-like protein n=1 Tax=Actinidia chinensis var. chinensis TaxID=1590841 RepID=A0A2R6Q8R2_ACTCC|nr:HMG1/2-like protein [Actinidia chinensis var. chinensis]
MKGGKSKAETKLSVKKRGAGSEKAGNKSAKKGKLANNPNKSKRPASAFFVFMQPPLSLFLFFEDPEKPLNNLATTL